MMFGLTAACKWLHGYRLWEEKNVRVCVFGGRNPSLMMETADLTLRMQSITGVTLDVADIKAS
jgi:hypothetical protein